MRPHLLLASVCLATLIGCPEPQPVPPLPPPQPPADVLALVAEIEDPGQTSELSLASFDHVAVRIVRDDPETRALVAKGEPAARYLATRFNAPSVGNRDYALAHYAYVIEQTKYRPALQDLHDFLAAQQNRKELFWAVRFAEQAVRTLEAP